MNNDTVLSMLGIDGCEDCPNNSHCTNVVGTNECQCDQGYTMNGNGACDGKGSLFFL